MSFLFLDNEKELSAIDIEWSRRNIEVSGTDMQRENDADVNVEPVINEVARPKKSQKGVYISYSF